MNDARAGGQAAAESPAGGVLAASGLGLVFPGGIRALADMTFAVHPGEFVAVVGPSGCGKSTLLRLVAGLLAPSEGSLTLGGIDATRARREIGRLGFVFQQPALLPWRTVRDNVRLTLELEQASPESERHVDELLDLVGLAEFASVHPHQLSGGMKMRVSLARALVTRPRLLLMDEPFGALDEITRQRLNEELRRLWMAEGCTTLFVTHNVWEAAFLAQRILVMSRRPGRVAADIAVPFDAERPATLRAQPEFGRFCGEVSARLEEASR